jgi:hypothetical protein
MVEAMPKLPGESFALNSTTGGIAQISFTNGGFNGPTAINGDGTRIAFDSAGFAGLGNRQLQHE